MERKRLLNRKDKEQRQYPFLHQRMVEQSTICALRVEQHPNERHEQECIASVCDRNAPRVAIDGEVTAQPVLVEGGLVEANATMRENLIHRHLSLQFLTITLDGEARNIIRSRKGARMIIHEESVETNIKR